ncbi:hypothetical protein K5E_21910 [Enterococcus thailandicus]|uniref:hypothetical protein n=1 Tax=Enterococcus thailandicus TaxID=417368 RepID=UPI00244D7F6C|nr:hypothetical protein [Enterococcus thailandicus]GMC02526.1 hypothetical protein K4E_00360 [Enterococcus thailandicus]GMC10052.1 hypothetical protein K5E_21910 [Enterococcus thailandicus]
MSVLFPEDYESKNAVKKRKLAQRLKIETELTALDIALNAHNIYEYLKQVGVAQPNSAFVQVFQYASDTLGVPYDVIDEAFFTQTPLDEKDLFDVSQLFNPNAKIPEETDLPLVPITIDFYSICLSLFEKLPHSFWEQYVKSNVFFPKENIEAYNLELLLQGFLQEVWLKIKSDIDTLDKQELENRRQMFLAYFYQNNQKFYRKETQKMLLDSFQTYLERLSKKGLKVDEEFSAKIKIGDPLIIQSLIFERLDDWTVTENYQRFLRSIPKTKNLSLINKLLLLYQRSEGIETKEINDWIRENRVLKKDAQPIFLFGEKAMKVDRETGEISQERSMSLNDEKPLPIIPYFVKSDTDGRELEKEVDLVPSKIFVTLETIAKEPIVFEEIEVSQVDTHTIRLKTGQTEEQTIQDLIKCMVEKEKRSIDSITRFENQSIASVVLSVFDYEPLPIDFTILENLRTLNNGKVKLQQLFTNVIHRSEGFLEKFELGLAGKEIEKIRQTFSEEIEYAKNLQKLAMANVATDKENSAEKKSDTPFTMDMFIQKSKESSEENTDD